MTREVFQMHLLKSFAVYGRDVDTARISLFADIVSAAIGLEFDWEKVFVKIYSEEFFFPTVAVIVKYARESKRFKTPQILAAEFVDRVIIGLTNSELAYCGLGEDGYKLMKKALGVSRSDLNSGQMNAHMMRKQWTEVMERYFVNNPDAIEESLMLENKNQLLLGEQSLVTKEQL